MWSRQANDYSRILCLSLVCHQETDLCRSPRETLLSLSFPGNDAILLSLQEITPLTVEGCKLGNFKKINNVEEKRIRSDDIINSYPFRNTSVT
jgi:hypothetical protein